MKSLWVEDEATALVRHYKSKGFKEDLALRIYSSRLLGADPRLVQHGGGNTSMKSRGVDLAGQEIDLIYVKGSGWDLGNIEPAGMPAMRLEALLALSNVPHMSDEDMVNAQRAALLDSNSPNPSVETLLHAWVPTKVIDHTHANAVLSLVDVADGHALAQDLYGNELCICDYVMPGFGLAHQVRAAFAQKPNALGAILLKHGIFSWGEDARTAYERMIQYVTRAEDHIARSHVGWNAALTSTIVRDISAQHLLPSLRGALAVAQGDGAVRPVVLDLRNDAGILSALEHPDLQRFAKVGPVTPDHVLRIKPSPLIFDVSKTEPNAELGTNLRAEIEIFKTEYQAYFARHNDRLGGTKRQLDPEPRIALVPGLGLIGIGSRAGEAAIAADISWTNLQVMLDAERLGPYQCVREADIFDVEYWSLEQAKLGKAKRPKLAGHVVVITGGAGAIGAATGRAFADEGAEVVLLDSDEAKVLQVAKSIKGFGMACDVNSAASVEAAFEKIVLKYGGLDCLVSNAGAAWTGPIGEVSEAVLRESFELNFFSHQRVAQSAVAIMQRQGYGGSLLFNASKQAVNPGPDFGPYGIPKAALIALVRQYAVEYGSIGIRSNAVNADRIRSGLLTDEMVKARSAARGLSEVDYMGGNLLGQEVRAKDVAQSFVALALAERTTGAILTVDGGNIAAALR